MNQSAGLRDDTTVTFRSGSQHLYEGVDEEEGTATVYLSLDGRTLPPLGASVTHEYLTILPDKPVEYSRASGSRDEGYEVPVPRGDTAGDITIPQTCYINCENVKGSSDEYETP